MIGTNKVKITFDTSTPQVSQGGAAVFSYAAPVGKTDPKNWIGIYAPGSSPGKGSAALWAYAPAASGSASFSTATLAVGEYTAWYLYQDGYAVLGGPLSFSVARLTTDIASVPKGGPVVFSYAVPAAKVTSTNWIGIWPAGATPGSGTYLTWQYVTLASGTASFDTGKLAPGNYSAWCLYNDGYGVLAGPCNFTVA